VLRDVRLESEAGPVRVPTARVRFSPGRARLAGATLAVEDQRIALTGEASWPPSPAPLRLAFRVEAPELDLNALVPRLSPWLHALAGDGDRAGSGWEELVVRLAESLRAHPRWLDRLEVDPARIRVGRLHAADLTLDDLDLQLLLRDGRVRVEQRDASLPAARIYALDLEAWMPRLDPVP
jgi:hypothetical protein